MIEIIAQGVGFAAFGLGIHAFSQKNDRQLKIKMTLFCLVLALHYYLLGAYTGMLVALITSLRNSASLHPKTPKQIAFVFVLFYLISGLMRFEIFIDLLPAIGSSAVALSLFYLKGIELRTVMLASTGCFIIYNISVGSIGPTIMESIILITNFATILKLRKTE